MDCTQRHRSGEYPGHRPVGEQPGRELAPALSKARKGHASPPAHAQSSEVRFRPLRCPKSLQHRTEHLKPQHLQAGPHRRSRRVAGALRRLRKGCPARTETSSHLSDSTHHCHPPTLGAAMDPTSPGGPAPRAPCLASLHARPPCPNELPLTLEPRSGASHPSAWPRPRPTSARRRARRPPCSSLWARSGRGAQRGPPAGTRLRSSTRRRSRAWASASAGLGARYRAR